MNKTPNYTPHQKRLCSLKAFLRRQQLTVLFAVIVFLFMFSAMLIVFLGAFILYRLNIIDGSISAGIVVFLFALTSLLVGMALSIVFSRFPLAPLRELTEATDRIARGDYSARINLKSPAELKRLSDKFNHMAAEIGSVEMLRNDFINNFSHEFKTPIVSIQGFAELLELNDLTPEERAEYIHIIIDESSRLVSLASNILTLSKVEQQTILTGLTYFNVSEQIRRVIALLNKKWSAKNIMITFDCAEYDIMGNEELLKQVWINLTDNAIKFSPARETVNIEIRETKQHLVFSFTNKGEEIPSAAIPHIFDKFYQADTSHATQGNGLGLTIASKIVELHGGTLKVVDSCADRTTFEVTLPKQSKE